MAWMMASVLAERGAMGPHGRFRDNSRSKGDRDRD
jgi:hypothetical protein